MYFLKLSNVGNPDLHQDPTSKLFGTEVGFIKCKTLEDCSKVCLMYIEHYDLGGGNWDGGQVFQDEKCSVQVAQISYNGRIWLRGEKKPVLGVWNIPYVNNNLVLSPAS